MDSDGEHFTRLVQLSNARRERKTIIEKARLAYIETIATLAGDQALTTALAIAGAVEMIADIVMALGSGDRDRDATIYAAIDMLNDRLGEFSSHYALG